MAETAKISLELDLARVQAELRRIPDLTAKEAREMSKAITKEVNRAARATEDAAKHAARAQSKAAKEASAAHRRAGREIERSYNDQFTAVEALSNAAIGGIAGDFVDLGRVVSGASGGMAALGAGVAALAIAPVILGGIASAARDIATASIEARARLDEQGIILDGLVSGGALAALDEYEASQRELAVALDIVSVELGSKLVPLLTDASRIMVDLADSTTTLGAAAEMGLAFGLDAVKNSAIQMVSNVNPMAGLLLANAGAMREAATAAGLLSDEMAANAVETALAEAEQRKMLITLGLLVTEEELAGDAAARARAERERATAAARAGADAARQLAKDEKEAAAAAAELERNIASATTSMSSMGDTITDSLNFDELREYNALLAEGSRNIETMGDPEGDGLPQIPEWARDAAAAFGTLASATGQVLGGLEQLARQEQQRHEERVRNLKSERSDNRRTLKDATRDFAANQKDMTALERQAAAAELAMLAQSTAAKNANIRQLEKEEERAANKAFRRMQSLKRAEATVAAAANAVALTLAMAYLGPGAPAAGLGIAGTQLGVQLAVINSTPKPKFHTGTSSVGGSQPHGIPGQEYTATLEQGEGVLSRRAMQVPGARDIVAALERNQRPQAMSAPPVVINDMQADALAARANRPLSRTTRGLAMAGRYSRR